MPKFLEDRLRAEAAAKGFTGQHADAYVYGGMNNMGAMHGSVETAKGKRMDAKHTADLHAHAAAHGHVGPHADAYVKGALHQRHGMHHVTHRQGLIHSASGHGFTGPVAESYADGAMNEAQGLHADSAAGTQAAE